MIADNQTNLLYLANCLPLKNPVFFAAFKTLLDDHQVPFKLIPHTKDIWAVDYMPIQTGEGSFVQFVYNPVYLQTKALRKTVSDVTAICSEMNISATTSNIILDGGNVVKGRDKVLMCDRVFTENPSIPELDLINELERLLCAQIIILPTHKHDFTGHADGMARFVDNNTVLINDYSKESKEFQLRFRMALHNARLKWVQLPFNPYSNKNNDDATGIYINYLQMKGFIMMATFGIPEDDKAFKVLQSVFPQDKILTQPATEIAKMGGILNCITWNIKV